MAKKAYSKYHRAGDGLFSGSRLVCTVNEMFDIYVMVGVDQREIAKDLNITIYGLRLLLKCAGISRRTNTEVGLSQAKEYKRGQSANDIYVDKKRFLCTKQKFLDLYVKEGLGISLLSEKLGVSKSIVWRIFKRYKIPTRNVSEGKASAKKRQRKNRDKKYLYKNGYDIICSKEDFRRLYYDELKCLDEIASIFHIARCTLSQKVHEAGFILRTLEENGKVVAKKFSFPRRENSTQWRGGRVSRQGYIFSYNPTHPSANQTGYVCEHRRVMEDKLGRRLENGEVVHHIDFVKTNNSSDNLYLYPNISTHMKAHTQLYQITNELYKNKIIIFEDGKYILNEDLINLTKRAMD